MSSETYLYGRSKELMKFGAQELPVSKEIQSIDWVIFGVTKDKWDNLYPQYIDLLSKSSAKNSAILKAKNRHVYGKGLELDTTGLNELGQLPALQFIQKVTESKVLPRLISDYNKHNGFSAEVILDKAGKKIGLHYLPFKNVRVSKDEYEKDEKTLKPKRYFYTKDWATKKGNAVKQNKDFTIFEPFTWETKVEKSKRYIIYYKNDEYSEEFYPLPDYIGGVPYISADSEVGNFVEKNTKNGFSAGYLINIFGGEPDATQRKEISDKIDETLHGSDNAGKSIKSFNVGDKGIEITPLSANGQDDRYNNLNNTIRVETFTSHCTPVSAVEIPPSATGLTNNADQDRVSIEKWTENWVIPNQEPFNELCNAWMNYNGVTGKVHLQRLDPIKQQLSETVIKETLSDAQFRDMFGLPPSDKEVNPVVDALRTLSPLVQNKILESMALSEIRTLIKLETPEDGITKGTNTLTKQFSKEDDLKIIGLFESCGVEDKEYHCFSSQDLYATDTFDAISQAQFMKHQFASKIQNAILNLLKGDPTLKPSDLSQLTGESTKGINDLLSEMESEGLIDNGVPTEKGIRTADENEIQVVYKYKVRDDVPPVETESRPFCKELIKLSATRSWTIEQIQNISNQVGYDVFARRGGWYHNPITHKNTPFCRHLWSSRLVRKA